MRSVLTIAGSDPSGHRGLQADLRVFAAHGVHGMAVPTALTVQTGDFEVHPVPVELVRRQVRAVVGKAVVVKVGMCATASIARMLAQELAGAVVVLDPVLASTSGVPLLDEPESLLPLAAISTLVTPNLDEARRLPALLEGTALLKGGHGEGDVVVDRLGEAEWRRPRLHGADTRGTGCRLSSAIAARLALGETLESAVAGAGAWLHAELQASVGRATV